MNNPKISIVVPIYKVPEKFLRRNIENIIKQTMQEIEIILVDDGSPDNCGKICDEYAKKDERIKTIHQENKGLCAARNSGVLNSNGDYVMFIDGDDFIELNSCEVLYNNGIKYNPDIILTCMCKDYGDKIINYDYNFIDSDKLYENEECLYLQEQVLNFKADTSSVNGRLIKREFMIKNEIFHDEDLKQGAEGLEFNIRLFAKASKVLFVNKVTYHYCYNYNSITEKHNEENHMAVLKCFEKIYDNIQNYKNKEALTKMLYVRINYAIITTAVSGYFSPTNPERYSVQKKKYISYLNNDIVKKTLKHYDISTLDPIRKITIFCIKHKLFLLVKIISILRYDQKKKIYAKS